MTALDLTILPGIESAIRSAARLTAAGHHESAKDDLRRAWLLAGEQLGLNQLGLAMMLEAALATRDDYELAKTDGRVVEEDTDPKYYSRGRALPRVGT